MKIGFIDYNANQAGHRLRIGVTFQFAPKLSSWMLRPQHHPLLSFVSMFGSHRIMGQAHRLLEVLRILQSSVVICSKPSTPRQLQLLEMARLRGAGVLVDVCDNYFINPYASDTLKNALDRAMQIATLVTVPSEVLLSQLPHAMRAKITVAEDAIDEDSLPRPQPSATGLGESPSLRATLFSEGLLWFGFAGWSELAGNQRSASLAELPAAIHILSQLADVDIQNVRLVTLSNDPPKVYDYLHGRLDGVQVICHEWSTAAVKEALARHPLVLLTYGDADIDHGKSANRVEVALASGCQVVVNRFMPGWPLELREFVAILGEKRESPPPLLRTRSVADYIEAKKDRVSMVWSDSLLRCRHGTNSSWRGFLKRAFLYVAYG